MFRSSPSQTQIFIVTLFLCFSFSAYATELISYERLFELSWNGKISYILATNHRFRDFRDDRFRNSVFALKRSQVVFLENSGLPMEFIAEGEWRPKLEHFFNSPELAHNLSPLALATYGELLSKYGDLSTFLRMKPGVAFHFVRNEFRRLRGQMINRYFEFAARSGNEKEIVNKFGTSPIAPNLLIAASLLLGHPINEDELIRIAVDQSLKDSRLPKKGMDAYIQTKAIEFKLPIHLLEQYETETELSTRLKAISFADLDQALIALSPLIEERTVASQFWNGVVLNYICTELSNRHFTTHAQMIGNISRLIEPSCSLTMETGTFLPGEKMVEMQVSNRHKDWLPALLRAIRQGGAFIAVGAAHVIPHTDHSVSETLLEMFQKDGIKIRPVTDCEALLD